MHLETLQRKVECLLRLPIGKELVSSISALAEIQKSKWLPGVSIEGDPMLFAPNECRAADQNHLVDLVWGTTKLTVKASWKKILGKHIGSMVFSY